MPSANKKIHFDLQEAVPPTPRASRIKVDDRRPWRGIA